MTNNPTAQVFRAKYSIEYGTKPKEDIVIARTKTILQLEDIEGNILHYEGYQADEYKRLLDKLGIHYNLRKIATEENNQQTNKQYLSGLKSLQTELSEVNSDYVCRGGDEYSMEIILETPTKAGSSVHISRRKLLEAFLNDWNISFSVECFTVHSDTVCRLA